MSVPKYWLLGVYRSWKWFPHTTRWYNSTLLQSYVKAQLWHTYIQEPSFRVKYLLLNGAVGRVMKYLFSYHKHNTTNDSSWLDT